MRDYKNDIEKYLKGELTPLEMNALEKKALQDPFLADALEGAQQVKSDDFAFDLNHLQATLNKRISKKHSIVGTWSLRIAAGLLVLALSTYVIILLSTEENSKQLALNKQKESRPSVQKDNPPPNTSDSLVTKNENLLSLQTPRREELRDKTKPLNKAFEAPRSQPEGELADVATENSQAGAAEKEKAEISVRDTENASPPVVSDEKNVPAEPKDVQAPDRLDGFAKIDEAKEKREDADDFKPESAKRKSAAGAPAKTQSFSDKIHKRVIRGKVTFSEDDTGLPGVNIIIKGTNEGTVTDAQGNYQIPVDDSQSTLIFSFIGFTNKEVEASSDELNVQLDADISELSEVVVVGYSSTNDVYKLSNNPPVMELATPAGGRKVFKQYLEENLRYPEQALKNQVEGKVTIQFAIGISGQLSDFRVIRGIGFGCDEEVIRLIKEGPKWSPTKKNEEPLRDRVKVRMRFALPKK